MELLKFPKDKVILTTPCNPVTDFSTVQKDLEDMGVIAFSNGLVGLAANQVGLDKNMFIVIAEGTEGKTEYKPFINPRIKPVTSKGKLWDWEGCGSIPNMEFLVERWKEIEITAHGIDGESFSITLSGFLARVCQHEENHLRGILINTIARQRRVVK